MGTAVSTLSDQQRLGIIPRVITEIFDQIDERSNNSVITITASYIELYNEQIFDLLADPHYKRYVLNKVETSQLQSKRTDNLDWLMYREW